MTASAIGAAFFLFATPIDSVDHVEKLPRRDLQGVGKTKYSKNTWLFVAQL